ncbi:hypothetical protein DFJ74DRAFT_654493 [Hyaloraphidium curvatum]|nr:hypothetical protein DFJ74DRAFT_654493 [Hyaloraphidium curvatum]
MQGHRRLFRLLNYPLTVRGHVALATEPGLPAWAPSARAAWSRKAERVRPRVPPLASSPALLSTRCFSSGVSRGSDPLGRLREVLQIAKNGRIPPHQAADRVWEAYTALGTARGLDSYLVAGVAHHLASHAVEQQAGLRGKGRTGHRERAWASLDQAAERMVQLFADATEAGIDISPPAVTRFVQLKDRHLGSYAECRKVVDFLRLRCRVALNKHLLSALLRNVAHRGNYTAFLKLLHEELTANPDLVVHSYILNLYLAAVAKASPLTSEDLAEYPRRQGSVADLAIPLWAVTKDQRVVRTAILDPRDLDASESAPDPASALREAIMSGPAPDIRELCRPAMPAGSTTPVRKIVQLLSLAAAGFRQGREDVLDGHVVTGAVEAFCAWKHPRCALATSELFSTAPFPIPPRPDTFNVLLTDACDRRDAVSGEAILKRMRQLGVKPNLELFTTMILFYGRTGGLELGKETLKEMVAAGYKPNAVTGMAVLEGILGPNATVEDVGHAMKVLASVGIDVDVHHWTKALRCFAQQQDLQGLMRVYGSMTVPPNEVTVSLMAKALADLGGTSQMIDFLKSVPPHLIGISATWSTAIASFAREWASSGDFVFRDAAFALSCAALDHAQLTKESLPTALRELPFVDMRPPVPEAGLTLVIFDLATRLQGEQLQMLTDKGRAYLVRNGYAVWGGADARAMHAILQAEAGRRSGPRVGKKAGGVGRY